MTWKLERSGDQSLIANWVNRNCEIWVGECKLLIDLISLTIKRRDVILDVNFENEIPFKEGRM